MPRLITQSKLANYLCDTEGRFQGWQNDQFRKWDSTALLAPDGKARIDGQLTPMLTCAPQTTRGP
jgi:hypothetical protein